MRVLTYIFLAILFLKVNVFGNDVIAKVKTYPIKKQNIKEIITTYGTVILDPSKTQNITSLKIGQIKEIFVTPNQEIKKGTPLFKIETFPTEDLKYFQAVNDLKFAERELKRIEDLYNQKLATNSQLDTARKNLENARAVIDSYKKLGLNTKTEVIPSPHSGIVVSLNVSAGDIVSAGTTVLQLATFESLCVIAGIEQSDLGKVKPKMMAKLTSIFDPLKTYISYVKEIKKGINPKTQFVDIILNINTSELKELMLGEKFKVEIFVKNISTFAVPRNAVLNDQKGDYIFIVKDGIAKKLYVKTGIEYKGFISISGNFQEGDKVVTLGNYELKDGMKVMEE